MEPEIEPEAEPDEEPEAPPIVTHDVNRLLQYLHDVNQRRGDETRDLASVVGKIEDELFDLSKFLRDEADRRWQRDLDEDAKARAEAEKPKRTPSVSSKAPSTSSIEVEEEEEDISSTSVTESISESVSTISEPSTPRPASLHAIPRSPISVTPPPMKAEEPSTPTTTAGSFWSSHYSEFPDEESILHPSEEESMVEPIEPSEESVDLRNIPSASSPSSPSSPSSDSSTITSTSVPSSPTSSSVTIQARPPVSLNAIKDALGRLEDQHAQLLDGQHSLGDLLNELRRRPVFRMPDLESDHGVPDGINNIQNLLENLLDAFRQMKSPRTESEAKTESEVGTTVDSELEEMMLREHWKNLLRRHGMAEPASMPEPPRLPVPDITLPDAPAVSEPGLGLGFPEARVGEPLEEEGPSRPETTTANIPIRRPTHRRRPRSLSPTIQYEPTPPSVPDDDAFADAPEGVPHFEGTRPSRPRKERPIRDTFTLPARRRPAAEEEEGEYPEGAAEEGPDLNMEDLVRRFRRARRPGTDGIFYPTGPLGPLGTVISSSLDDFL